jgi:hypothetical protein
MWSWRKECWTLARQGLLHRDGGFPLRKKAGTIEQKRKRQRAILGGGGDESVMEVSGGGGDVEWGVWLLNEVVDINVGVSGGERTPGEGEESRQVTVELGGLKDERILRHRFTFTTRKQSLVTQSTATKSNHSHKTITTLKHSHCC